MCKGHFVACRMYVLVCRTAIDDISLIAEWYHSIRQMAVGQMHRSFGNRWCPFHIKRPRPSEHNVQWLLPIYRGKASSYPFHYASTPVGIHNLSMRVNKHAGILKQLG